MKKMQRRSLGAVGLGLISIGLVTTLSLVSLFAVYYNESATGQQAFNPWYQLTFVILGIIAIILASRLQLSLIEKVSVWWYLGSIILLVALVIWATPISGASRWFDLGPIQLQPSEIAKLALITLLARLLAHRAATMRYATLALSAVYMIIPAALVVIQPDLGTAVLFIVIWLAMLSVTPMPRVLLVSVVVAGIGLAALSLPLLADYQQKRISSFLNPAADPQGAGYNAQQAMIAVGSGQLVGRGLDSGSQSQLNFLPAKHTDFIFAVIAEKLGFIGAASLIAGLATLVGSIVVIARQARSLFGAYLATAVAALIGFQAVVNLGMNLGLLPVTGIPLPFVSYGGTHTVMGFLAFGLVIAVSRSRGQLRFHD